MFKLHSNLNFNEELGQAADNLERYVLVRKVREGKANVDYGGPDLKTGHFLVKPMGTWKV